MRSDTGKTDSLWFLTTPLVVPPSLGKDLRTEVCVIGAGIAGIKENLNVARQYVDYVTPGEVRSEAEIRPGQGAVVRHGLKKLAVYRDEAGGFHRLTAVCPHLGCIVHWNSLERTWDCPCHGSRFSVEGSVLNGPALGGLEKVELSP